MANRRKTVRRHLAMLYAVVFALIVILAVLLVREQKQATKDSSAQQTQESAAADGEETNDTGVADGKETAGDADSGETAGGADDATNVSESTEDADESTDGSDGNTDSEQDAAESTDDSEDESWALLLVNSDNPLPEDYSVSVVELSNGESVDERIYPALQQMFDDMRAQGVYPVVRSGYRSYDEQVAVMEERISRYVEQGMTQEDAKAQAETEVAIPGTSEHQTGLGVDINADGVNSTGEEVYNWLLSHAWEYGFIKRYPEDKTDITGIVNEPWHYRYVGKTAAAEMYQTGQCLEEYLAS